MKTKRIIFTVQMRSKTNKTTFEFLIPVKDAELAPMSVVLAGSSCSVMVLDTNSSNKRFYQTNYPLTLFHKGEKSR